MFCVNASKENKQHLVVCHELHSIHVTVIRAVLWELYAISTSPRARLSLSVRQGHWSLCTFRLHLFFCPYVKCFSGCFILFLISCTPMWNWISLSLSLSLSLFTRSNRIYRRIFLCHVKQILCSAAVCHSIYSSMGTILSPSSIRGKTYRYASTCPFWKTSMRFVISLDFILSPHFKFAFEFAALNYML